MRKHHYQTMLKWTGSFDVGTKDYKSYSRDHVTKIDRKLHTILGSSDPSFRGDPSRYNPEELFQASISNCHMLWYLHLCSVNKVIVLEYQDRAMGTMEEDESGGGQFVSVTLYPSIKVKDSGMIEIAQELHEEANRMCFIANSCNFCISHQPNIAASNQ